MKDEKIKEKEQEGIFPKRGFHLGRGKK